MFFFVFTQLTPYDGSEFRIQQKPRLNSINAKPYPRKTPSPWTPSCKKSHVLGIVVRILLKDIAAGHYRHVRRTESRASPPSGVVTRRHWNSNYKTIDPAEILLSWCKKYLDANIHTNFCSEWVLGFVIDFAWTSKHLRDATFYSRESCHAGLKVTYLGKFGYLNSSCNRVKVIPLK